LERFAWRDPVGATVAQPADGNNIIADDRGDDRSMSDVGSIGILATAISTASTPWPMAVAGSLPCGMAISNLPQSQQLPPLGLRKVSLGINFARWRAAFLATTIVRWGIGRDKTRSAFFTKAIACCD